MSQLWQRWTQKSLSNEMITNWIDKSLENWSEISILKNIFELVFILTIFDWSESDIWIWRNCEISEVQKLMIWWKHTCKYFKIWWDNGGKVKFLEIIRQNFAVGRAKIGNWVAKTLIEKMRRFRGKTARIFIKNISTYMSIIELWKKIEI
jgi:hypothetical protein